MTFSWISRRQRSLLDCAPAGNGAGGDRAMRSAVRRASVPAQSNGNFACQQAFDSAASVVVRGSPIPPGIEQWFANEKLVNQRQRTWKTSAREPAILAICIAVAVMAGVFLFTVVEHMNDFPGSQTARKLLLVASTTRASQFEPVDTEAGDLGDWFFMKFQLEHYDVPPQFADFKATGCRVFDDQDGHRVAQIFIAEKRMQFFLFPSDQADKKVPTDGWKYVEQEGWTGAVQQHEGVCFMAVLHGDKEDLAFYLTKTQE